MLLLQSVNKYDRIAALQPDATEFTWYSRTNDAVAKTQTIAGSVAEQGEHTVALYRLEGLLHFKFNGPDAGSCIDITITENIVARLETTDKRTNRFSLYQGAQLYFETVYMRPQPHPPPHLDPTPFVSEEDHDYYLFVYNVLNDVKRRHEIYR